MKNKMEKRIIIHKSHATKRKTVCGIKYDGVKDMGDFINNQIAGHWKKVTCKNCIKKRKYYESRANRYNYLS